jgi:hypothetical protein
MIPLLRWSELHWPGAGRPSVAILANGALLVRAGLVYNLALLTAAGLAVATVGAALWVLSGTSRRSPTRGTPSGSARPRSVCHAPVGDRFDHDVSAVTVASHLGLLQSDGE